MWSEPESSSNEIEDEGSKKEESAIPKVSSENSRQEFRQKIGLGERPILDKVSIGVGANEFPEVPLSVSSFTSSFDDKSGRLLRQKVEDNKGWGHL